MVGTGFSPRQPLADLGMVSTRVEGQLPGARLAYWSRPLTAVGERPVPRIVAHRAYADTQGALERDLPRR